MYIRDDIARGARALSSGSNGMAEWLSVYFEETKVVLVCIYRSPVCTQENFEEALHEIEEDIESLGSPSPTIMLCGDFNMPSACWDSGSEGEGTGQTATLVEFCDEFMMSQLITAPTRLQNILDY